MPTGHRPQPPVDTIRVAMGGINGTLPWTCVFYLSVTTDGTRAAADLKTIVDGVVASFFTNLKTIMSASVTLENAQAVWITGTGTALEYNGSYSDVMTGGTEVANAASCYVVNMSINQYYRGGHPRMYLPGVIAAAVSNLNTVAASTQANIASGANAWIAAVNALTAGHILSCTIGTVSYARANAWRATPVFFGWKSANCRTILGTQRRRLGGR